MELIVVENVEFTKAIDEVNNLFTSEQKEKYKIVPRNIEFNFGDLEIWFGAITAVYTVIQIVDLGGKKVNEMVKNRELKYEKDQETFEIKDVKQKNSDYFITVEDKEVKISVKKEDKAYSIKIDNVKSLGK
ncbi:hypothetical protein [Paenibacillus pedocola]|uniref:hypothetical protein n=1 Tax=Paenibacillus pedocola TaxID=3242193 RepID=UPI0028777795|nr:hypothetical protein [Paenibacillus typhae]